MNILNPTLRSFSGRFFAAVTIVSLLMSAFPVAFFVAEAAVPTTIFTDSFETPTLLGNWTEDGWASANDAKNGAKSAKLVGANNTQTMSKTISTAGYESIEVSFWFKAKGLEWDAGKGGFDKVEAQYTTDGSTWTTFYTIDGDDSNGVQDDETWYEVAPPTSSLPASAEDNTNFGLRFKGDLSSGNDTVWIDDVTLAGVEIQQSVDMCPNMDGDQAEVPDGYELDDQNNCVPVEEPPVDYCDPAERPGGMSVAEWHDANDFDGSSCFDYEVTQQCGSLDVQFTANETGLSYEFRYALGSETPANWEGDGVLPVYFNEDENGGSVDVTYYVVGAEKDYFVGSDVPNFWDGNGETVTVDTDCQPVEPKVCTLELVSDTDDYVVEKDANAQELSFIHTAWTALIDSASWIWGDDPVVDPANDETQTFSKKFGWAGTVDSAMLYVASDNDHSASLNGEASHDGVSSFAAEVSYDVAGDIQQGNNTLEIAVTNVGGNSDPEANPAGLLYKLVIETTDDVDCDIPYQGDLEITSPATDDEVLSGTHSFEAVYDDEDYVTDVMRWAIRDSVDNDCSVGTTYAGGNITDWDDSSTFDGASFAALVDMSTWDNGDYCFVVNPDENASGDGSEFREVRNFVLENEPTEPDCAVEGHKYDQSGNPLAGWTIGLSKTITWNELSDTQDVATDVTDEDGYYCLVLSEDDHEHEDGEEDEHEHEDGEGGPGGQAQLEFRGTPPTYAFDVWEQLVIGWSNHSVEMGADEGSLEEVPEEDITEEDGRVSVQIAEGKGQGGEGAFEEGAYHVDFYNQAAPYCGDGEINQDWEQCDGDDVTDGETCTDYCTLGNQCTDLRLVKITLDDEAPESVSFDDTIHLGEADNTVPSGAWFNFDELGDDTANTIANEVDGLAVSRSDTDLTLAVRGGNARTYLDYVFGSIETLGIDLGAADRSPIVGWPLEDGGTYPDVFDVDGDNDSVEFKMWLTTGDDAASVEINDGEEYDCPACMAVAEARIILDDSGYAGEGQDNSDVLLGDGTRVEYGEWFPVTALDNSGDYIADAENATNFTDAETTPGLFVSRNGDGTINVTLVGDHSVGGNTNHEYLTGTLEVRDIEVVGAAEIPGDFQLEDHSEVAAVPTNDGYDNLNVTSSTEVDFGMWVDIGSDGFKVTLDGETLDFCEDDDDDSEPETYLFDGYKYETGDDYIGLLSGWTIYLLDDEGEVAQSTTTDANGYYWFETLTPGVWEISEEMPGDWEQDTVYQNGNLVEGETCVFGNEFAYVKEFTSFVQDVILADSDEDSYSCDFYNVYVGEGEDGDEQVEEDEEGTITGTRIARSAPGRVLGASTSQCGMYLYDYMKEGQSNESFEVMKLQAFLTGQGYWTPMTGVFDDATDQMVRAFQAEHMEDVLMPWYEAGYANYTTPTGWVYQLTRWKINNIVCPGSEPLPVLIP